jgi:8-oxo-dGTP pyrophosphatase MutT (NUDIX family)
MATSLSPTARLPYMSEELVALYTLDGAPTGTRVPRSVMRRDNLVHGVASVVVRDSRGRVYVHRRTETKDVFPGDHDAFISGCMQFGESPEDCAQRELAEELGITGVSLTPVLTTTYEDVRTRQVAFVFLTWYDGPVAHQPEEIAWGGWMTVDELRTRLTDSTWRFVPDGRALLQRLLERGLL